MVDRKTELDRVARGRPVRGSKPDKDRQVVHAKLQAEEVLSIDDSDFGTDPYNRTGRFTALQKD